MLATVPVMGGYGLLQAAGLGFTPGLGARVSSSYCKPKHFAGFLDLTLPPALALTLWSPQRLLRLLTGARSRWCCSRTPCSASHAAPGGLCASRRISPRAERVANHPGQHVSGAVQTGAARSPSASSGHLAAVQMARLTATQPLREYPVGRRPLPRRRATSMTNHADQYINSVRGTTLPRLVADTPRGRPGAGPSP